MTDELEREISQLVDPAKNLLAGVIGLSKKIVRVTTRKGFVWVRLLDNPSEAIQAYNRTTSPVYGLPVLLSYDGVKYTVEEVDANRYADWKTNAAFLPKHGYQHSAMKNGGGGGDVVWVAQEQFMPLLPTPQGVTGSSNINVSPYTFRNSKGNWIYAGNTGIHIPPNPSITGSVLNLVMLKDDDGSLYVLQGDVFDGVISGTNSFVKHLPSTVGRNNNDIPVVAVNTRSNDGTRPLMWQDLLDVRQFYKGFVKAPTGTNFIETMDIYNSGTFVGRADSLNFLGDYSVTMDGQTANIRERPVVRISEILTPQVDGSQQHFILTGTALSQAEVYCNLRQPPSEVVMDTDMRGFALSFAPTIRDTLFVDYMMLEPFTYTVDWIAVGGGGGGGLPGTYVGGGGGGGGGVAQGSLLVVQGQSFSYVVGSGGAAGVSGSHSSFYGTIAEGGFAPVDDTSSLTARTGGRSGYPTSFAGSPGVVIPNAPFDDIPLSGGGGGSASTGTYAGSVYAGDGGTGVTWMDMTFGGGGGGAAYGSGDYFGGRGGINLSGSGNGYGQKPPTYDPFATDGADGRGEGGGGGGRTSGDPAPTAAGRGGHGMFSFRVPLSLPVMDVGADDVVVYGGYRYYNFITPRTGTIKF